VVVRRVRREYSRAVSSRGGGQAEDAASLARRADTGLVAGNDFSQEIDQQINDAKAVIAIWTPASVNSRYVTDERQRGWKQIN